MPKRTYKFNVTHVFADGTAMTDEEFMGKSFVVSAERNYEFMLKSNRLLDPNYEKRERLRRRWESAEKRKAELVMQQAEIARKLAETQ